MPRCLATITFLAVFAPLVFAACGDDDGGIAVITTPQGTLPPGAEATYGAIDRFPGGTAVVRSDYTVTAIACDAGKLRVTTTAGVFTGTMDCEAMVTPDIVDRFLDKPALVTITATRIKLENPEAGSLDFPATEGKLE
jgi:hypothetical protein